MSPSPSPSPARCGAEGYHVVVTADGPSTLKRALTNGIDLIVLDIGLPVLDGLEVCRRVRAEGHGVPVLILTAPRTRWTRWSAWTRVRTTT